MTPVDLERPDLSHTEPEIRSYIEALEAEVDRLSALQAEGSSFQRRDMTPVEPPGPLNIITATASGLAKRTPVHFYARQRRGGMGIFDLDAPRDEPPSLLSLAEDSQTLLLVTSYARAFHLSVNAIQETSIRARGNSISSRLNWDEDERLVAILPVQAQGYLLLLSRSGMVRSLRHHIFGDYMKPGLSLYDIKSFGTLGAACWTPGDGDVFIATQLGKAIRFSEKNIPPQGCLGIRLAEGDAAISVAPAYEKSEIFLLGSDGRGTVRSMAGFNANKSPGSGGKIAMSTGQLVGTANIDGADDLFILSKLSKIIRFHLSEVPVKDGVVQGVSCIGLRADEAVALAVRRSVASY
jgi:DNA gyrase subunit A